MGAFNAPPPPASRGWRSTPANAGLNSSKTLPSVKQLLSECLKHFMRLWGEFSQYRATVSAERTLKEFKQSKGRVFVQFGEFLQYRAPFCNCARRPLLESDERLIFSVNYLDNAGIPVLVFVRMVPYMQCIHFSISFLSGISVINKYNPV